jgi:hypothetical protein
VLACVAVVSVLSGCGSGRPVGVVNVAESYLHDLADARYGAACGLFTDDLRRRLGDCEQAVRRVVDGLPVRERDELRYVRVRKATYHGNQAQVYPADVTTDASPTPVASGKPKPRRTAVRSIAANHALDGHSLTLEKVGDAWLISGGVGDLHQ